MNSQEIYCYQMGSLTMFVVDNVLFEVVGEKRVEDLSKGDIFLHYDKIHTVREKNSYGIVTDLGFGDNRAYTGMIEVEIEKVKHLQRVPEIDLNGKIRCDVCHRTFSAMIHGTDYKKKAISHLNSVHMDKYEMSDEVIDKLLVKVDE